MFLFLLIVQTLVAASLIAVILMQRSEGGGFTSGGGSPSGLMTARGAADFLTRATTVLATLFVVLSIVLAALAAQTGNRTIDADALKQQRPPAGSPLEQQPSPFSGAPQPAPGQAAPGQPAQPAPAIPTLGGQQVPAQQQAPATNQAGQ